MHVPCSLRVYRFAKMRLRKWNAKAHVAKLSTSHRWHSHNCMCRWWTDRRWCQSFTLLNKLNRFHTKVRFSIQLMRWRKCRQQFTHPKVNGKHSKLIHEHNIMSGDVWQYHISAFFTMCNVYCWCYGLCKQPDCHLSPSTHTSIHNLRECFPFPAM